MTQQNTNLDVSQQIANSDGTPSRYFEELWYSLVATTGGEDGDFVNDLIDQQKIVNFSNLLHQLSDDIKSVEEGIPSLAPLVSAVESLRDEVEQLSLQIGIKQNLTDIYQKLEELELAQRPQVNLTRLEQRINDLEAQI